MDGNNTKKRNGCRFSNLRFLKLEAQTSLFTFLLTKIGINKKTETITGCLLQIVYNFAFISDIILNFHNS